MNPKTILLLAAFCLMLSALFAQNKGSYTDSIQDFRNHYIQSHEVVGKEDRQFMQFFPIDEGYRVKARFEPINHSAWFQMNTSGKEKQTYRRYGRLSFELGGKRLQLFAYQSQSLMNSKTYKNYLFIPFTDSTSGIDSYGGGRYLDYEITDIRNNVLLLDFNKAYNPYCAYTSGYDCPIPPKENDLPVAIQAGEKNFGKRTH